MKVVEIKIRLIWELINGISRVLQKILQFFNGTDFLTSFTLPAIWVFPVFIILDMNDSKFTFWSDGWSL